jgi:hypothetical protein
VPAPHNVLARRGQAEPAVLYPTGADRQIAVFFDFFTLAADNQGISKTPFTSIVYDWAVCGLGMSMSELSRKLELYLTGVIQSVKRGEKIANEGGFCLII